MKKGIKKIDRKVVRDLVFAGAAFIALLTIDAKVAYDAIEGGYGVQLPFYGWFIIVVMAFFIYDASRVIETKAEKREKLAAVAAKKAKAAKEAEIAARNRARFEQLTSLY